MFSYFLIFIFLFGLCIGSFINCLIYRLHAKKSLWDRSFCPKCKHKIAWYDNVPVLSWIILKGKCRHCKEKISWEYPVVEFVTGVLFVVAFLVNIQYPISNIHSIINGQYSIFQFLILNYSLLIIIYDWFIISVMIVIFLYDLKYYLILDIITLPSIIIVIIINLVLGIEWQNLAISGIIGLSFFLFQFIISQGKWIGGGDLRLGLLMGLALGWPLILTAIFLSYIIGSIIGIYLLIKKKKEWGSKLPLGVFLAIGTIVTILWGEEILSWYLNVIL